MPADPLETREATMAQIYFHCSSPQGVLLDRRGSEVEDMVEAAQCAAGVVQILVSSTLPEDWRDWVLHASDEDGEEIFAMAFSAQLGKPH